MMANKHIDWYVVKRLFNIMFNDYPLLIMWTKMPNWGCHPSLKHFHLRVKPKQGWTILADQLETVI